MWSFTSNFISRTAFVVAVQWGPGTMTIAADETGYWHTRSRAGWLAIKV